VSIIVGAIATPCMYALGPGALQDMYYSGVLTLRCTDCPQHE
jgi:hypothetical protein